MRKFLKHACMFLLFVCFGFVLGTLVSCSDFEANTTGKMNILSVGLNYRGSGVSELRGTINDATEFGAALSEIANSKSIPKTAVFMLQEGSDDTQDLLYPTAENIFTNIKSFSLSPNDLFVMFYSGHGQDVYWSKCDICGHEEIFTVDSGDPGEVRCAECANNLATFTNLSYYLASAGRNSSTYADLWLNGNIGEQEYIAALESDECPLTLELLGLKEYAGMSEAPLLEFSLRAFMVTAYKDSMAFEDWASEHVKEGTLGSSLVQNMLNDNLMPDPEGYSGNITGYYSAVSNRISYYSPTFADKQVFELLWSKYMTDSYADTIYTKMYMDELVDLLETLPCRVVLFTDCCYSGYIEEGRDYTNTSFGKAFSEMFKKKEYSNVTVVSASAPNQTSLDSSTMTDEGEWEPHGLLTISLLKELGWKHSKVTNTYVQVGSDPRTVNGYLGSVPNRTTVRSMMENVVGKWTYENQTPLINSTYLETVIIP